MRNRKWFALVLLITTTQVIAAEQTEEKTTKKSPWSGDAELGFIKTTGNTQTETFVLKANVIYTLNKWRHIVRGEALRNAEGNDIVTAEKYFLSGKSEYTFRNRSYVFGLITYDDDRFSGFDYVVTGILGYGRVVMKRDNLKLNLEVGAGGRQSEPEIGETNNEGVIRGAGDFEWKISKNATFVQELSTDVGQDKSINRSLTSLTTKINSYLSSRIAYQVRYTSEVPPGIEKTDTELTFTLVAKY
jgi:putative salt-induced outer membrane protein